MGDKSQRKSAGVSLFLLIIGTIGIELEFFGYLV